MGNEGNQKKKKNPPLERGIKGSSKGKV